MSMKSASSPRRIYTRNDVTHVCFEGRTYGAPATTEITVDFPVTCVKLESDGGKARIEVTQKRPHAKTLVETWRTIRVPTVARRAE